MGHRIFPAAKARLEEVWIYTAENCSEAQADRYIRDFVVEVERISQIRSLWKLVRRPELQGLFCFRFKSHLVFFRELGSNEIGVVTVLHTAMDIPNRLLDELGE